MMARYNRWQNEAVFAAADQLDDAARDLDRGAFWGSISGTLAHLLWGDGMWMSRFDGGAKPDAGMSDSAAMVSGWSDLCAKRRQMDDRIDAWAATIGDVPSDRMISFYSGVLSAHVTKPLAMCATHFFNHQTHHRGQVHGMLTAAGVKTEDSDLFLMPDAG